MASPGSSTVGWWRRRLWLELPLPAQLVEYYWDVGHVGHAVGRFCRGKLARPDGVVQEVGVDAA